MQSRDRNILAASESHFHFMRQKAGELWQKEDTTKGLLWWWTLSVLVVQPEAAVRGVLRGSVKDRVDKPFKFSVCIVLRVATHKIVLPLQCVGVLWGRGRPAVHLLATGPQGCAQDVLLRPRPFPGWKRAIDSCKAKAWAVIVTAGVEGGCRLQRWWLRGDPPCNALNYIKNLIQIWCSSTKCSVTHTPFHQLNQVWNMQHMARLDAAVEFGVCYDLVLDPFCLFPLRFAMV